MRTHRPVLQMLPKRVEAWLKTRGAQQSLQDVWRALANIPKWAERVFLAEEILLQTGVRLDLISDL